MWYWKILRDVSDRTIDPGTYQAPDVVATGTLSYGDSDAAREAGNGERERLGLRMDDGYYVIAIPK